MAITKFFYVLFALSIIAMLYTKETTETEVKKDKKPKVVFENSVMYEIDTKELKHIIQSSKTNVYDDYEEMFGATVIAKSNSPENKPNNLSANQVVKIGDRVFLYGDVLLQTYDDIILRTREINYNLKSEILKNDVEFELTKGYNIFLGEKLFFDLKDNNLQAKNSKIRIELKDKKDVK
jgi:LPS export ABC transporter protein LptC